MIYLLGYLVIGMIYSGLTFKKLGKGIALSYLSDADVKQLKSENKIATNSELSAKIIAIFIFIGFLAVIKILFWPFTLVSGIFRKGGDYM
ncbi:MAG: hypothetical protein ABF969_04200 [Sporolactobacillus sp.]